MQPKDRLRANISLMQTLKESGTLPTGSIVECGVWKGGMSLAMLKVFGKDRSYVLFDSFEGLPTPSERDGDDARWWASHTDHPRYFNNCKADYQEVSDVFNQYRNEQYDIKIIKGWFENTLTDTALKTVAFAHIDCDWYDSVFVSLETIWSKVPPGGVIVIDDYYDWEGCRKAVHDFLSSVNAREAIERVGSCGGVMIKRLGAWNLSEPPHMQY